MEKIIFTQIDLEELLILIRRAIREEIKVLQARQPAQEEQRFDIHELCEYLLQKTGRKPAVQTIYGLVSKRQIPSHKFGSKLYFLKSEIDAYLKNGKRKTLAEIDAAADESITQIKSR